ncbi:MAG: DNA polymerase III subunit delta [Candidatus Staskawiczbacteria bacterium]|nr:DNA polymerase III subunit delta [Candidatus Staskawiczbacteria bacterium]
MPKVWGGGIKSHDIFERIISLENLFFAWNEFKKGKRKKPDVQEFEYNLEDNIFLLYNELKNKTYRHSNYTSFFIKDPKLRKIHKATVKDRVLHHAIFRILYPIFDKSFIFDSYSCRIDKGTHRAVNRLNCFAGKISKNNTKTCYILKCDIRKYFDSIDQDTLISLIKNKIKYDDVIWLIIRIIKSFPKGLPLGNITSQLFANIYLGELDKFIKHELKEKYYIRYCDDFTILSRNYRQTIRDISNFLKNNLKLSLHKDKIIIRKYHQGIDFLGYVVFPHYRILRIKTKNRIIKNLKIREVELKDGKITKENFNQTIQSYLGVLKHCNGYKVRKNYFFKYLSMIIFLYGEDTYRSRQKLNEIIDHYKKIHKSGMSFGLFNFLDDGRGSEQVFLDFKNKASQISLFSGEKKLLVVLNIFSDDILRDKFLKEAKDFSESEDVIILLYEPSKIEKKDPLFKFLNKNAKCQEFNLLKGVLLKNWLKKEFEIFKAEIDESALERFFCRVSSDLWHVSNEIKKLACFKNGKKITKDDVDLFLKPKIENDIFKTIDALASKNKKEAISLLHKHLESGENVLRLLSMIAYQFRTLLIIKELAEKKNPYPAIAKKSGLHPFVVKKTYYLCSRFSFSELKKIYQKIFQADLDIKSGRLEPEAALELLVSEI